MEKNENKSFIKSFFQIGVGTVLTMAIGFFTTPILTRMIEPNEYGKLSIFTLYISIAVMFLCFGFDQTLMRFYYENANPKYRRELVCRCFYFPLFVTIIVSAAFYIINKFTGEMFEFSSVIFVFLSGVTINLIGRFINVLLRLNNHTMVMSLCNVLNKALYILIAILLLKLSNSSSYKYVAFSVVASSAITVIIGFCFCKKLLFPTFENNYHITYKSLLKYGAPFILTIGLETIFASIDKICLKQMCDYDVVGVYSSALTIVGLFAIISSSFNLIWAPVSIKHYEENPEDRAFYSHFCASITLIVFLFGFSLIAFKDVIILLLGESYRGASVLIPFLCFHPIMYTISETTVTGIVVKKKSYYHLIIIVIVCITNLVGNMVLIPYFGGRGAAISTGLSYIVFYLLRTIIGYRYFGFDQAPIKMAISTVLLLVFSFLSTFLSFDWWMLLFYVLAIFAIVAMYSKTFKRMVSVCSSILGGGKKKYVI